MCVLGTKSKNGLVFGLQVHAELRGRARTREGAQEGHQGAGQESDEPAQQWGWPQSEYRHFLFMHDWVTAAAMDGWQSVEWVFDWIYLCLDASVNHRDLLKSLFPQYYSLYLELGQLDPKTFLILFKVITYFAAAS
jgi:hypothetical protein